MGKHRPFAISRDIGWLCGLISFYLSSSSYDAGSIETEWYSYYSLTTTILPITNI